VYNNHLIRRGDDVLLPDSGAAAAAAAAAKCSSATHVASYIIHVHKMLAADCFEISAATSHTCCPRAAASILQYTTYMFCKSCHTHYEYICLSLAAAETYCACTSTTATLNTLHCIDAYWCASDENRRRANGFCRACAALCLQGSRARSSSLPAAQRASHCIRQN
jgi:hypothetical protein